MRLVPGRIILLFLLKIIAHVDPGERNRQEKKNREADNRLAQIGKSKLVGDGARLIDLKHAKRE